MVVGLDKVAHVVDERDTFKTVVVTEGDPGVAPGLRGVLMDVFDTFVVIETPPSADDPHGRPRMVARSAVELAKEPAQAV